MQMRFVRGPISIAISGVFGVGVLALATQGAYAQQAQDKVERVTVTGSSIKQIESETSLPVQVITRQDIERIGATNAEDLLKTISSTNGAAGTVVANASGATTSGISTVSLRGLGQTRTLVLVNGRRVSNFGGAASGNNGPGAVDVNSIPISAIERIEVLKDGASAIYGSDAVAGVINFILKDNYTGSEITVGYGTPTHSGGGDATKVSALFGSGQYGPNGFNLMGNISYDKETALYGRSRDFASSVSSLEHLNDYTSGNTYPANLVNAGGGTRNPLAPRFGGAYGTGGCAPSIVDNIPAVFPDNKCRFDPSPYVALMPDQERINGNVNGRFKLSGGSELYGNVGISQNTVKTTIQPAPISDIFSIANSPYNGPLNTLLASLGGLPLYDPTSVGPLAGHSTFILQGSSPYYPHQFLKDGRLAGLADGDPLLVRYRSFENGLRSIKDENTATRFVFGTKGTNYGWDYDGAFTYTTSQVKEYTTGGYPLYSKLMPLLNSGVVNPFGASSPAVQQQLQATNFNGLVFQSNTTTKGLDLTGSREIGKLPAGSVMMAAGAAYRVESFKFTSSDGAQTGDISGYGGNFLPVDKSRNVSSVFTEFSLPLAKKLDANLAARYDNYQNVGSTTNPKLSVRWQPRESVLVRGAIGTGFRAPSLTDLYAPQVTGVTTVLSDPLRCGLPGASANDCGGQFPLLSGGNPNLKPEKSLSKTLGLVLEPTRDVHMAFDVFDIELKDMIVLGGAPYANFLSTAALATQYGALVTRGAGAPGLPGTILSINGLNSNLGKGHVNGIDVDLRWRLPATAYGRATLALNGTYMNKYEVQDLSGTMVSALANADVASTLSSNQVVPRWKHIARLTWDITPWSASLIQNYQSGYHDLSNDINAASGGADLPREVPAYITYDLQGSYTGFKDVRITGGVRNVTGVKPPYSNVGGAVYFQGGYDPSYADPRLQFVYVNLTWKFK